MMPALLLGCAMGVERELCVPPVLLRELLKAGIARASVRG